MEKLARFPGAEKKRRILSHLWLSWFFGPEMRGFYFISTDRRVSPEASELL